MDGRGGDAQFLADLEELIDSSQAFLRRPSTGSDLSLNYSGLSSDAGGASVGHAMRSPEPSFAASRSCYSLPQYPASAPGGGQRRIQMRQMLDESFIHTPEMNRLEQQLDRSPQLRLQPRQSNKSASDFLRKANQLLESAANFHKFESSCAEAFDKSLEGIFAAIFEPVQLQLGRPATPTVDPELSLRAMTPRYTLGLTAQRRSSPTSSSGRFNPMVSPLTGSSHGSAAVPRQKLFPSP
eukprot:jgi/Tetstr1/445964/TSEL_033591.t1